MVGLQLVLIEVEPEVAGVGTSAQALGTLLAEVDGKDVGEGTWRMQEDAAIQLAGTEAGVVGNVAVEEEEE